MCYSHTPKNKAHSFCHFRISGKFFSAYLLALSGNNIYCPNISNSSCDYAGLRDVMHILQVAVIGPGCSVQCIYRAGEIFISL